MEPQTSAPKSPSQPPTPAPSTDFNNHNPNIVPEVWPGAFGIYKRTIQAVMVNIWVIIILVVLSIPGSFDNNSLLGLIFRLISAFAGLMLVIVMLASSDGKKISILEGAKEAAQPKLIFRYIGLYVVSVAAIMAGLILLIVPAFIILPRLALAPYYLIDRKQSVSEALHSAWNETRGHSKLFWGIVGVYALTLLAALIVIAVPVSILYTTGGWHWAPFIFIVISVGAYNAVMFSATLAILYRYITKHQPAVNADGTTPPTPLTQPAA